MAQSSNIIGKVIAIQGNVSIRLADKTVHPLKLGDVVHEGDVILTGSGGFVELGSDNGGTLLVRENEIVMLDATVFGTPPATADAALLPGNAALDDVAKAIADGGSLDALLDETAAGFSGGGGDDGSHSFVRLLRIAEALNPVGNPYGDQEGLVQLHPIGAAENFQQGLPELQVSSPDVFETGGFAVFNVSLSSTSTTAVTVNLAITDDTATSADHGSTIEVSTDGGASWVPSTSVVINPGTTSVLVRVSVTDDSINESAESFTLTATSGGGTSNDSAAGTATIVDNESTPSVFVNDVTVNEAAGTVTFTVSLSNSSTNTVSVNYATGNGTAAAGSDYTAGTGTLTFAPGQTSRTVTVAITDDLQSEGNEAFNLTLSSPVNATIADASGVATIIDNDSSTLSVSNVTVGEGDGFAVFTLSLSSPSSQATTVSLGLNNGSAGSGDFGPGLQVSTDGGTSWVAAGTATFAPGITSLLVRTPVVNDDVSETSENFTLTATVTAGRIANTSATGTATITDNDTPPALSINDVTVNEAAGTMSFTVSLSRASSTPVTVNYATGDGSATAGSDYTAAAGTVSFAAGETSKTITIVIGNDAVLEGDENFKITLSGATNAVIADGAGIGTIVDNDTPSLSVSNVTVSESAGHAVFTVSLSNPSTQATSISLSLNDGSAGGADYGPGLEVSTDGGITWIAGATASIAAGATSVLVRTPVISDAVVEGTENFTLTATAASGTSNGSATGTATVVDASGPPSLFVNDVTVNEAAGTATFTVSLSTAATGTVTVDYATSNGTATAGSDYTAGNGTLTFAAGETTKTITVAIGNDNVFELAETFNVTLSNAANAVIGDATGIGTITDNDTPTLAVSDVAVNEADGFAVFNVSLSNPSSVATTVSLALANGSAGAPDFGPALQVSTDGGTTWGAATAATIAAGATSVLVRTAITNDNISEAAENFTLTATVTAGTTSNVNATGTATITDNDGTPTLSVNDVTVNEAAGTVTFTVTLSNPSSSTVTVDYATSDGSAMAGTDYTAVAGTVTFAAGETSKTITVAVSNDNLFETSETLNVTLSNPANATIADGTGIATLTDNDLPTLAVSDVTVSEGGGFAVFTVSLSNPSVAATSVSLALTNGTAGATDFGAGLEVSTDGGATWVAATSVTIAAGATDVLARTAITDDALAEGSENFTLTATAAVGTTVNNTATGTATIIDNDGAPLLTINDVTVNEAAGTVTFTVLMSHASSAAVSVNYATSNGTATAGTDYTATNGTLNFLAGETSKTITVSIANDNLFEVSETFNVTLSSAVNATIADGTGVGTITDNDTPTLAVSDVAVNEAAGFAVFNVSLSNPSSVATTVSLALANGSAGATDFGPALQVSTDGGTTWGTATAATIAAGQTSVLVRTAITNDNISEPSENFTLTATVTAGTTSNASATGTATITDNDGTPTLSVNDVTVSEAAGTVTFTVTLSNPSSSAVSVDYATSNGTAIAGSDYTAGNGTLSFAAGETTKTITVAIADDTLHEGSETFNVTLSNPSNATIADGTGIATITDNDIPALSVSDVSVNEGAGFAVFTVSLSNASVQATSVSLALANGTAGAADFGPGLEVSTDGGTTWTAATAATIGAGATSVLVRTPIANDALSEGLENFTLTASVTAGTTSNASATGTATIVDNDGTPALSIDDVSVNEADGTVTFTVIMSNASSNPVTVDYATANGTATAGSDYTATNGTLSFAAGETSKTITVAIANDALFESSETFNVTLANAVNATIADNTGVATITDNDTPTIAVSSPNVNEGDGFAVFTVSLSNASAQSTSVSLALTNGTAGGTDFGPGLQVSTDNGVTWTAGTTATIAAGVTSVLVRTPVINDTVSESAENFTLTATAAAGTTSNGSAIGTATIIDNDGAPTLSINDVTVNEAAGTLTFTVSLSNTSSSAVTVDYATSNGTATAASDYTAGNGTLTFAAGETSKTITVAISNDSVYEGNETFNVTLSNPSNATIIDGTGVATITDNDTPTLSVSNTIVAESAGHAVFTISLSNTSVQATTVALVLNNGTAGAADFGPGLEISTDGGTTWTAGTSATIAAGTTSVLARTTLTDDNISELSENFTLSATVTAGTTSNASASGTATITDNDGTPQLSINDVTVNEAAGTATFTVSMSNPSSSTVTVDYATSNGTATSGSDYTADNGTLSFAAGETSKTVTVTIANDNLFEVSETFNVVLSNAVNAAISDSTGVATITDNDTPALSISSTTVNEGDGFAVFTVSLSNPSSVATTVSLALANGTATAPDYGSTLQVSTDGGTTWGTATSATIAAGQTSVLVRTAITNDNISEGSENFTLTGTVTLGTTSNASATGTATITDNDGTPTLSINDVTVNEAAGTATFTVTLSNPSSSAVTANYATSNGTATAGSDYTANTGTVSFAAGETSKTITVAITNDNVFESSETFNVTLSSPTNATIADGTGVATITDNDTPTLSVSSIGVNEGDGFAVFTVSLSNPSTQATTVSLALANGTAGATDFGPTIQVSTDGGTTWGNATSATITAGATSVLVRTAIINDSISESTENFTLTATVTAGTTSNASATGTATITDNDAMPAMSINDVTVNEAAGTVTFTVTLNNPSSSTITADYATSNGTATAGSDYTAATGTVSFAAGETSKTITVSITNDSLFEASETFNVTLSNPSNATIADNTGVATITDNDTPTLSVSDTSAAESDGFAVFTVSLSNPSSVATTVSLALANGTAVGSDFGPGLQVSTDGGATWGAATSATIAAGATSVLVRTPVTDDTLNESSENFTLTATVTAGTTSNASATGTATITDNDALPSLSIDDVSVNESAGTVTFTVSLSAASGGAVSVNYATSNGTATAGGDYTATTGTLNFASGETTKTITVAITNDTVFENSETFTVNLSGASNASIANGTGVATIIDNDTPALSVSNIAVNEGDGFAVFTVSLSNTSTVATSFSLALNNGTAGGTDFGPGLQVSTDGGATWGAATSATIAAGATSVLVRTALINDNISEVLENFSLTATVTGGTTSNAVATGTATIADNDGTPTLSINDVTVNEAAGTATFTVTLSNPSSSAVTVDYATSNDTATAGSDYTAATGTVTFAAGETTKTITVAISNDNLYEVSETFNVTLTNPANATVADGSGVATITDNDTPSLAVSSAGVNEGDGYAVFTVSLSNPSSQATSFALALANGTAGATDFGPALEVSADGGTTWASATSATIAAGATGVLVRTPITNDTISENTENFSLTATVTGGTTSNAAATGTATITDNDGTPQLTINDVTVNETAGTVTFTVTMSNASSNSVTVDYGTSNGTATAGTDYTAANGTLSFAPGETSKTITIAITNDIVYEGSETFNVMLSNAAGAAILDGSGLGTIVDTTPPTLTVSNTTVNEGDGFAVFTLSLSTPSSQATTMSLALANLTASAADFGPGMQVSTDGGATWNSSTSATIAAGATSVLVRTPITDDNISESSESFTLTATVTAGTTSNASAAGTGTIVDNETTPQLTINDITVNEAAGTATFTVTLSHPSSSAVSVNYATQDGTALAGDDYTAATGTVNFAAGETSKTITVAITNDTLAEDAEAFNVTLSNAVNANIADNSGTATITDNDLPTLSVSNQNVSEGDGFVVFTVSLSNPSVHAIPVSFALTAGSAGAGDFGPGIEVSADGGLTWTAASGAIIAAGAISVLVRTPLIDDAISETLEDFTLTATAAASLTTNNTAVGTATIVDNDGTPQLSINDVTVNEDAGTVTFTVSMSNPSAGAVTVDYATSNGTAVAGSDYTATNGTLSFAAGETSKTITFSIADDNLFEISETFNVTLTNPTNATIADGLAVGTITDNDTPTLSISSPNVNEGDGFAVFTVSLSNPSSQATTVSLALGNGTATAPDFGPAIQVSTDGGTTWGNAGSVTIAAGTTSVLVRTAITNDNISEGSESFTLTGTVTAGTTSNASAVGTATIVDNDGTPSLAINDVSVNEAAGTATFTVTLSNPSSSTVSVDYATGGGTATAGTDYTAINGTVSFAAGETSKTITVSITNDALFEVSETFNVTLTNPTNATIADNTGVATIVDNDTPTLSVSSPTVTESAGFAVFTVSLSNASSVATSVSLALANGTAGAADFGPGLQVSTDGGTTWGSATSATIAAGSTSVLVRTPVIDDALNENSENFTLTATVTAGTTSNANATGTATITDNDPQPSLSINDVTVSEAAGTATFTVTLSAASGNTVTVNYATGNGTAAAGSDYTANSGTLTFAPGETSKTIVVNITNDAVAESSETFNVTLSGATNATIADNLGVGTITDNDFAPVLDLDASGAGTGFTATFTENGAAVSIADTDISITDTDSTTLTGATITLTNAQTGDVLAAGAMPAGITSSVVGNTITLSGSASLASYQTAIRAITFSNTTENPNTTARSITVVVNDGANNSNTAAATINVVSVNDAPTAADATLSGTEDTALVFTWANFGIADVDNVASSLSLRVKTLPLDGTLQVWNGAAWTAVVADQLITKATIDSNGFRFMPDANESGHDSFPTAGTGNLKTDYASFTYQAYDGALNSTATSTARIDIAPVADTPSLTVINNSATVFTTGWETPASTVDSNPTITAAATLESWTLVTAPDTFGAGTNVFKTWTTGDTLTNQGGTTITASAATGNGIDWLDLSNATTGQNQTLGVSRSVATVNGRVYELSLDAAGWPGFTSAYTKINVLVDGVSIGTYSGVSPQNALDWSNLHFSFTGNGANRTITILTDATSFNNAGRGMMIDDISLRSAQGAIQGNANSGTQTSINLSQYITSALVDTDGSEVLTVTIANIPSGGVITTAAQPFGISPLAGSVTLTGVDLASATLLLPSSYLGSFSLNITSTATEPNGSTASNAGTLSLEVLRNGVDVIVIDDPGVNDAPIARADAPTTVLVEDGATTTLAGNAVTGSGAGNVVDTDSEGDTIRVTGAVAGSTTTPASNTALASPTTVTGTYGSLQIAADGSYTYTLNNGLQATQNLMSGETATDVFTYKVTDGTSTATATITVRIQGAADINASTPTLTTITTTGGLNGEYYGYNDSASPGAGFRLHSDDGTVGNLDRVSDLETLINARNVARGGPTNVVGTEVSAVTNAPDVRFSAKTLDYGFNPVVGSSLGTNPNVAAGNSLSTTNDAATNAFSTFLDTDDVSAKAEQGTGGGSGLGKTSDAMVRLTGAIFFERGNYDFRVIADDGFRLKVAGETLIEFDGNQAPTSRVFTNVQIDDRIEGLQPFELLYWEQGGNARLRVEYKLTSETTFKLLSLDNLALFTNENAPVISDRRTQDIVETATNGVYAVRTGSVIDGGSGNDTLTGNAGRDFIHAGDGNDTLSGGGGADYLEGGSGNDTLDGGDGPDILDGGTGSDTMQGGLGDDLFLVDSTGDVVSDSGGTDTVELQAGYLSNYTLGTGLENLTIKSVADINGTGNALSNRIVGGDGSNVISGLDGGDYLIGGKGNDTLTGGNGSDVFAWNLADRGTPGSPAIDVVTDFTYGTGYSTIESGTTYGNPANGTGTPIGGGDRLDLRDLLSGENSTLVDQNQTPDIGNLLNYLDIVKVGSDTVIRVSTTGGFTGGTYSAAAEDQRITLQGVDLFTATGMATETTLLQELLKKGTLLVD